MMVEIFTSMLTGFWSVFLFSVDSYCKRENPSAWSPCHIFLDDSKRRSERAGIMEKPPIPNIQGEN
jgi:hypothetical protein